jgi:hypothetical protein
MSQAPEHDISKFLALRGTVARATCVELSTGSMETLNAGLGPVGVYHVYGVCSMILVCMIGR